VEDRLVAGLQVDNPKSLEAEANAVADERAARVGTAMLGRRAHPFDQAHIGLRSRRT
jgi:hypothetical protein